MKFAVFLRNVNLSQRNSPTRPQFEGALGEAGGLEIASFQTNGTAVFVAPTYRDARQILTTALRQLEAVCDLREPGCVRSMRQAMAIARTSVFDAFPEESVYEPSVSFPCVRRTLSTPNSPDNDRGDVRILKVSQAAGLTPRRVGQTTRAVRRLL